MRKSTITGAALIAASAMVLSACSGGTTSGSAKDGPVTLTVAGWSLASSPELQTLADAFQAENEDITVELVEYDAANYDTQIVADLAAGTAPDLYPIKTISQFPVFQNGGQLLDVSDVAADVDEGVESIDEFTVDGVTYAVPYRQDVFYLYYNKDLFDAAGIDYPNGEWTWEQYEKTAIDLTAALKADGNKAKGTYQHSWQSFPQAFANAQAQPDGAFLAGDWEYLVDYYERAVRLQDAGAQETYGTVTTNSLTYQGQFGTQQSAMMLMGSWYAATLLTQRDSGDAEEFEWSFAPAPQVDSTTVDKPVTTGTPTPIGINAAIDEGEVEAAKKFLTFLGSEEAALVLADLGAKPSVNTEKVADALFAREGMPQDELARFAATNYVTSIEAPLSQKTPALQAILAEAHSAIMSGSVTPEDGIEKAMTRAAAEVLN
ncbi:extracellular solute-binding protein [Microbacterium sp. H1-D42]|uniref:ABC transporter substrate-binding protein n=1 Tax=Microbacterium sp. H1-D42 TaxID=2925844 RepID=UPI001F52DCB1|nr:extracellular solute-binding protein [Microbacterium sp. H1-D42]UNK72250.1 extracellular solute-binding protein [Microbacterium sp. H1-D42]